MTAGRCTIFANHFRFALFTYSCKFPWNLNLLRSIFPLSCFIHLSAALSADGSCDTSHNTSLRVHFHLLSTSCELFSHFWLFFGWIAIVDHCEVPTRFSLFRHHSWEIWNWTRNQIREKKSIKKRDQLSQNIWRKAFQALASFGESIKVENFVGSLGWLVLALRL